MLAKQKLYQQQEFSHTLCHNQTLMTWIIEASKAALPDIGGVQLPPAYSTRKQTLQLSNNSTSETLKHVSILGISGDKFQVKQYLIYLPVGQFFQFSIIKLLLFLVMPNT